MTDIPEPPTADTTLPAYRTAEIAAYLAARMCHDFISPASAIASGLDLLEDPSAQDMREEAMGLIISSSKVEEVQRSKAWRICQRAGVRCYRFQISFEAFEPQHRLELLPAAAREPRG